MNEFEERVYTKTRKVLVAVRCNKCGAEFKYPHVGQATRVSVDFGYGSKFDGDRWEFDLCDDCFESWTKDFVYPVGKNEDDGFCDADYWVEDDEE